MRFEIPLDCPVEEIKHIHFFVRIDTSKKGPLQARAFLGSHEKVEMHPIFLHGSGSEVQCPFSGFLHFELAPNWNKQPERKCNLEIVSLDAQMPFTCTLYSAGVQLTNGYHFQSFEKITQTDGPENMEGELNEPALIPFFSLDAVQVIPTEVDKKKGTVSFDNQNSPSDEYIFLYCHLGEQEVYNETDCELFIPKNHYLPDEPIVATYRNLYDKYDVNLITIDLMFYLEGDRPGTDKSRDYVTLMFREYSKGSSGSVVLPAEGARNYRHYLHGNYTAHLMQNYDNLCPPRTYTVSDEGKEDELNAPSPGTFFFIKADRLPESVRIRMQHPERLITWRFVCNSPVLGDFEQRLYRMADVSKHLEIMDKCNMVSNHIRESVILQFLQTAFARDKLNKARYTKGDIPDDLCRKMILFIEDNLCNHIHIGMLMEAFHCSESFLSHYFKKNMHVSFSSYIYRAKMTRAKQWLVEGNKTISEIAELLNYSDVQAFSHAFRRMTGETPTAYREIRRRKNK